MEKKQSNFCALIVILVLLSGCGIHTVRPTAQPKMGVIVKSDEQKPSDAVSTDKNLEKNKDTVGSAGTPASASAGTTQPPAMLPKFGFLFSGGGAKAWAHIGVLKELQKLKWPVSAVGGFEWGAVVAATYAENLSANEVEWEMSKLKDFDKWDQFIKAAYPRKMTADLKVPFVCASLNIAKQTIYLLNRGQLDQLLPFCLSAPGVTKPINQSVAVMTDLTSLAQHLRATGATKIILINVLAQQTKRSFLNDFESSDNVLWAQSAALMAKKPSGIDEVVDINLDNFGIKDLDKRREIVAKGSELSYTQLKKLAEKYGL